MPSHYGSKRKKVIKASGKAVKALAGDAAKREKARRLRAKRKASKEPIDAKAAQRREKELEQIKRNLRKLKKEHEGKKAGAKVKTIDLNKFPDLHLDLVEFTLGKNKADYMFPNIFKYGRKILQHSTQFLKI